MLLELFLGPGLFVLVILVLFPCVAICFNCCLSYIRYCIRNPTQSTPARTEYHQNQRQVPVVIEKPPEYQNIDEFKLPTYDEAVKLENINGNCDVKERY
ncbi:unnamed protein product [Chironomus riparius]|uniref:Uncharacterized protein n=1 Tax=Chironomus riparius TaxID=315576 RepID=A0A9N9S5N4_9DIPT|nr:unnamed protein product [Chironomus riparius]